MAKTNFSKVEDLLDSSLQKMKIDQWGKLAEIAQNVERPEMRKLVEQATLAASQAELDRKALLHALSKALKDFQHSEFYAEIEISRDELAQLIQNPKTLKAEQWVHLQKVRAKIAEYRRREMELHSNESGDRALVAKERHKHINKRFKVKDSWLPLK
jgi:hypothetical protein